MQGLLEQLFQGEMDLANFIIPNAVYPRMDGPTATWVACSANDNWIPPSPPINASEIKSKHRERDMLASRLKDLEKQIRAINGQAAARYEKSVELDSQSVYVTKDYARTGSKLRRAAEAEPSVWWCLC